MNALKFITRWDAQLTEWHREPEERDVNVYFKEGDYELLTFTNTEKTNLKNQPEEVLMDEAYQDKWLEYNIYFMN